MNIRELVKRIRAMYLDDYAAVLADERKTHPDAVSEVLLQLASGQLYRVDILHSAPDKPVLIDVNSDRYVSFSPVHFQHGSGLSVELSPFYWNAPGFIVMGLTGEPGALQRWTTYWLDPEDSRAQADVDFGGFAHTAFSLEQTSDGMSGSVDLGSAPENAFWELLDQLAELGATSVRIGSFSMLNLRGTHTTAV